MNYKNYNISVIILEFRISLDRKQGIINEISLSISRFRFLTSSYFLFLIRIQRRILNYFDSRG